MMRGRIGVHLTDLAGHRALIVLGACREAAAVGVQACDKRRKNVNLIRAAHLSKVSRRYICFFFFSSNPTPTRKTMPKHTHSGETFPECTITPTDPGGGQDLFHQSPNWLIIDKNRIQHEGGAHQE